MLSKDNTQKSIDVCWFRQDLRLKDNPALLNAAKSGHVLPIYILDDVNAAENKMGKASRIWLHHSLLHLNNLLDGKLLLFYGCALSVIKKIVKENRINSIHWNRCYEPWRICRDKKIKQYLLQFGIKTFSYKANLLWEPWEVLKADSSPYKVFTHFYKNALLQKESIEESLPAPRNIKYAAAKVESCALESLNLITDPIHASKIMQYWTPKEETARQVFDQFLTKSVFEYKKARDFPARDGASKLSPYLHFGQISPRTVWNCARLATQGQGLDTFLTEVGWREFSYYLLYHFPHLPEKNLQEKFNKFPWHKEEDLFEKWKRGQTGYPIVDAGMRQLLSTGYMHNRVRMIVGSFLTKNLFLHWKLGERWFWQNLFDADLASNSASWQWVAGCGVDASPYFRVFNPVMQGQKFDASGSYIKSYVKELEHLPSKHVFKPWEAHKDLLNTAGIKLGQSYPYPIVDLQQSRQRAIEEYKLLKEK